MNSKKLHHSYTSSSLALPPSSAMGVSLRLYAKLPYQLCQCVSMHLVIQHPSVI